MPKRSSNFDSSYFDGNGKEINEKAFSIVQQATGEAPKQPDNSPLQAKGFSRLTSTSIVQSETFETAGCGEMAVLLR
jgi:hypothetical protein